MNQQSAPSVPSAPRRRHLIDPDAPRKPRDPQALERLHTVQRRVVAALLLTTMLHMTAALIIAADHVPEDRLDAQIGLNVLAGAFGVLGIAATLVINKRSMLSWWLVLGALPAVFGIWWVCW